jgi:DNA repair exonuclease SbcCD ATPase subunit
MADNTTTYTAVIDTEVKGGEQVEQLGENAEQAADGFVKLQLQIRQTQKDLQEAAASGDKVKFNKLRKQLDDLEDGLEKVQLQSKQFEDQLATLPGPAGAAGNAIKSVDGAFKVLIANPIIAVIAAIGGALLLMKKSLESTAEGQQTLNRLSQAFSSILGPILATVEKVAVPLFNGFAFVLEKVGEGFNKFAKFLGIADSKIKEATLSVDKVQQEANEKEKKRLEDLQKKKEEDAKKHQAYLDKKKAADEKAAAEKKKKEEEAQKNLDEANRVQIDAYIATLSERDAEIYKLGEEHNKRMAILAKAGITDLTAIQEQYRIELAAINGKYDEEEAKKIADKKKKEEEDAAKKAEEDKQKAEKQKADDLLGLQNQLDFEQLSGEQKKAVISQQEAILLNDKKLTENERTAIQKEAARQRKSIDDAELENKRAAQLATLDLVQQFGSLLQQIAGKNKKVAIAGIIIEQAAAIAKIIANTAIANAKMVAAFPITGGMPWVAINTVAAGLSIASTIAAAAKSIREINSADSGNVSAASTSNLPRMGTAAPVAPSMGATAAPVIQGTQSATPGEQIAGTLAAITGKPVKAYVVSGDVSSQQALDRRTSNAATFGGY